MKEKTCDLERIRVGKKLIGEDSDLEKVRVENIGVRKEFGKHYGDHIYRMLGKWSSNCEEEA